MEAVAQITNRFFTVIICLDRIFFLHPISWCAFLFSIAWLYADHRKGVVVSIHWSFFPFRKSYLVVRKCCTWDSNSEENNFWFVQAMKCEGQLIYNLILAEFHMSQIKHILGRKQSRYVDSFCSKFPNWSPLRFWKKYYTSYIMLLTHICSLQERHFILLTLF